MSKDRAPVAPLNVVVTGMHRSGTSAVALSLANAGISRGSSPREMGASVENPVGFAEHTDIARFNDELLRSLEWTWDAPASIPLLEPPDRRTYVRRGRKLMRDIMPSDRPWLVKDPRISLLLPWWRKILLDRFVAVLPWRPVEETAWSVHIRNDLPLAVAAALTVAYYRHLAVGLRGLNVIVVDFADLTERPGETVPQLLTALREAGLRHEFDQRAAISSIVPELHRSSQPPDVRVDELMSPASLAHLAAWPHSGVQLIRRFMLEPNQPTPWEAALLDLQRSVHTEAERADRLMKQLRDSKA